MKKLDCLSGPINKISPEDLLQYAMENRKKINEIVDKLADKMDATKTRTKSLKSLCALKRLFGLESFDPDDAYRLIDSLILDLERGDIVPNDTISTIRELLWTYLLTKHITYSPSLKELPLDEFVNLCSKEIAK